MSRPGGRPAPTAAGAGSVNVLSLFIVLLVAIPSRLIVGPLGGAGTPAQILAVLLAGHWAATSLLYRPVRRGVRRLSSLHVAILLLAAAIAISYTMAQTRAIDGAEARSADIAVLVLLGWIGLAFSAMDFIPTRALLDVLLRRLVLAGALLATLGIIQFATKQPLTNYIEIPGLHSNSALNSVYERGGLARPAGTALHPLEFAAVLTMMLPVALHLAVTDDGRSAFRRWYPVAVIAAAVPLSISRSAIVSAAVVLLVVLPSWPRSRRHNAYIVMAGLMVILYLTVPGLIGTISGLFTGISSEGSAQSRTGSYALAGYFIEHSPLFGRGFGTFLPAYRILDNQYLGMLIETGVVGLGCLIGVFVTALVVAARVRRSARNEADRSLALALAAAVASASASLALFDGFSFPMAATLVYFLIGCIGALRRLVADDAARHRAATRMVTGTAVGRRAGRPTNTDNPPARKV